jgi:hypothetical protein
LGKSACCRCSGSGAASPSSRSSSGADASLARAVLRHLLGVDGERAHLGGVGDARAQLLGEIGHRLDARDAPPVDPAEDLVPAVRLDAELVRERARLGVRQIAQVLLHATAKCDG